MVSPCPSDDEMDEVELSSDFVFPAVVRTVHGVEVSGRLVSRS